MIKNSKALLINMTKEIKNLQWKWKEYKQRWTKKMFINYTDLLVY